MVTPIPDEQAALLATIVAHPDEDTPRLVYADWLQEHGDEEQAQFIRDSIKLSKLKPMGKARKALQERLNELSKLRKKEWLRALGVNDTEDITYDRGMPHALVSYARHEAFFRDAEVIFARLPIRSLLLHWDGWGEKDGTRLRALAAMPGLAGLQELCLMSCGELPFKGWSAVVRSPHVHGLQYFGAVMCRLGDSDAKELAQHSKFTELTTLDLPNNKFSVAGILAIVRSPRLANVTALSFADNESDEDDYNLDEDEEVEKTDRPRYRKLVAALTARFGNANALTMWLR